MGDTGEEPYHEMMRHLPFLWTVIKYLPGRDLIRARLIDPNWKEAIDEILHHQEGIGTSPLKPIKFRTCQIFELFQAAFPAPVPPDGFQFFHFANFKLYLEGTPVPELQQILQVYCPHLKFATIGIDPSTKNVFQHLRVFLNHSRVLEKLSLTDDWGKGWGSETLPEIVEPVVLAPLLNLSRIHLAFTQNWDLGTFLEDVASGAPNLRWTSVYYDPFGFKPIRPLLKPFEHTLFKLKLIVVGQHDGELFNQLEELNLNVRDLDLRILLGHHGQQGILNGDWLRKINNNGLQKLALFCTDKELPVDFPPLSNIRSLKVSSKFVTPIEPSQVPNLEEVRIHSGYLSTCKLDDVFAPGKEWPTVKKLEIELGRGYQNSHMEFSFPNLESLELRNVCFQVPAWEEGVFALRKFLQFPNLAHLCINFPGIRWDGNSEEAQGAWWDLVTGGILPRMDRNTSLDVIYSQTAPSTTEDEDGNEIPVAVPSIFDLLPNLKNLELGSCPEKLLYAVVHLTATERIQCLETLLIRMDDRHWIGYQKTFKRSLPLLKAYHKCVVLT